MTATDGPPYVTKGELLTRLRPRVPKRSMRSRWAGDLLRAWAILRIC